MIISLVDLASSTLATNDSASTSAALNVVLDFMDHAGSLYEAVAADVAIDPVVYGGDLSTKKTEKMYKMYVKENAGGMGALLGGGGGEDRTDRLRAVFDISEKKVSEV